uniref:Uncharacterized protein n=1 Tax=Rhizophora mucronata TaxID=61149 RepID=A0A2P2MLM4_RHIMU
MQLNEIVNHTPCMYK